MAGSAIRCEDSREIASGVPAGCKKQPKRHAASLASFLSIIALIIIPSDTSTAAPPRRRHTTLAASRLEDATSRSSRPRRAPLPPSPRSKNWAVRAAAALLPIDVDAVVTPSRNYSAVPARDGAQSTDSTAYVEWASGSLPTQFHSPSVEHTFADAVGKSRLRSEAVYILQIAMDPSSDPLNIRTPPGVRATHHTVDVCTGPVSMVGDVDIAPSALVVPGIDLGTRVPFPNVAA
eukprot:CAMPEP_0172556860 /NCGR_PEP_ID=MMETSP1067-20121228/69577_1 /TAXON_ID=265564 ORGANISM="Thalassiosira punctigera, Strain Tpunct2005C2" /NCGR_SAMPLE_ID=MMETSP1067 /ASSEMBLY_ACC=CAM_ASM_000444 /LENGTH=233 /DNA_ID=CAMNT_0013345779 /DNA_START=143 /DNA_END=842 /DNA_ORIENTATION=+